MQIFYNYLRRKSKFVCFTIDGIIKYACIQNLNQNVKGSMVMCTQEMHIITSNIKKIKQVELMVLVYLATLLYSYKQMGIKWIKFKNIISYIKLAWAKL